jgi:hypothetical protein
MMVSGRETTATDIQERIVDALWNRVVGDAVGVSEPALTRYTGSAPDRRFWLGFLAPESRLVPPGGSRTLADRFAPAAQGFSFRVATLPCDIELTASFALWISLHPTVDEQRRRAGLEDAEDEEVATGVAPPPGVAPRDLPMPVARVRMKVPVDGVRIAVTLGGTGERTVGADEFDAALRGVLSRASVTTTPYRPLKRRGERPKESDLTDAASWAAWERENLDDPALPTWKAAVDIEVGGPSEGPFEVLVTITNRTEDPDNQFVDTGRTRTFPRWACDPNLYEVRLSCTPAVPTVPYELEQIPDSYRYDRQVPALGVNSAVEVDGAGFRTTFAAIAVTDRVYPRTETPDGSLIDTRFTALRTDPLPALDRLVNEARRWTDEEWGAALDGMRRDVGCLPETLRQAEGDAADARAEVAWVEAGVRLLRTDEDLLTAFKLMNETMELVANGRYDTWRPFQVAFILGCLSGVKDPRDAPEVDILWFSTGGGKTEAYLGLNVVQLFYERLKGRTGGAQTWARFPLRLLSLQQTQRIADSVLLAELVRRRQPRMKNGESFAVGYYVGAGNTPNSISLPGDRYYNGWDPFDRVNAESCRVLELCPACRDTDNPPVVRFDRDSHSMVHECPNPGCPLYGRLPVYVIDDDIYRRAPSVIVGTVDKLAQLGQQASFRILLGKALAYCPRHGYSPSLDRCAIFGCREALQPVPAGFGGLNFEIQDELHLLNESLGALDGNYETLFQTVAEESGTPAVRIIGATATIEGYEEQARHLYRRRARRFPIPGPTKSESFWAFERRNDPLRTYVAMLPRGTTMLNAAFFVTQSHWRFVEDGLRDPSTFCTAVLGLREADAAEVVRYLRDLFEVMVTYGLRKQDLERYAKDILEDPEICPSAANYDSITGDVEFWNVRDVLNRLEYPPATAAERIRVLGATSAISHGVDVNRLNVMTVMGMPKQTSEFIQATARVGRRYPAVVFTLVNPMRERDISHFRYFRKYAEYLDRLVEPVPVNRESLPVLKQVLGGGLMALLLQVDEPEWLYPGGRPLRTRRDRLWHVKGVARALDEGFMSESALIGRLLRAFAIDPADPRFTEHRRAVEEFVSRNLRTFQLQRASGKATKDEMEPPPPRSLRDVESTIEIVGER